MKTLSVILLGILFGNNTQTVVNDNKYAEVMASNIQIVYTAQSIAVLQNAVNTFERIGLSEKTKWEPYYYAAFGYIMMANQEQKATVKDAYLDQATNTLKKAAALKANDSEIVTLEGFVHMVRLTVDPESRGQQYSTLGMQKFGKANSLDPENPRALALMAQMQMGTAQFLGSPITEACATNESALQKFAAFKSDNPFAPQWGRAMAEETRAQCK